MKVEGWMGAFLGVGAYGVAVHWATQSTWRMVGISALSISFLLLLPAVMGAVILLLSPARRKTQWWYAVCAPWVPCLLVAGAVIALDWELTICVLMALPIFSVMASIGGIAVLLYVRNRAADDSPRPRNELLAVGVLLLLPHLGAPVEGWFAPPAAVQTVSSSIEIHGEAADVWAEFVGVPAIQPHEEPPAWFPRLGLPRPVTAQVDAQELPAMRTARYSNGMAVLEPITTWEPPYRYGFDVLVDGASLPHPLWQAVASDAFRAESVAFEIVPHTVPQTASDAGVTLYLHTTYRVQTPVNGYATLWIDFLLRDFQGYILQVIKARAEGI
ncbi:MAG: hypothetical protein WDZ49_15205 [Litorilinea sp.]